MSMVRGIFTLVGVLIIGLVGYQIGISQNIAQLPASAAPVIAYGYAPLHFGLGLFGLLFPILFFFLFIGLVGKAFGHARDWRGHGGHGSHGGWGDRRSRLEEWHREAHGDKPSSTSTPSPSA